MIVQLKRAGLLLATVNGCISERLFKRWLQAPRHRRAAREFDLCRARSEGDGERLTALGAPKVLVAGDIKFDAPTLPADRRELAELAGLTSGRQIWVAASTHEGEERSPRMRKAPAPGVPRRADPDRPRHPERGKRSAPVGGARPRVRPAFAGRPGRSADGGLPLRHDRRIGAPLSPGGRRVRWQVLRRRRRANRIEPAKLACAILHGPMVANFAEAYAALDDAGGALAVARPEDLGETLIALFANAARLRAMARSAGDKWIAGPAPSSGRCAR